MHAAAVPASLLLRAAVTAGLWAARAAAVGSSIRRWSGRSSAPAMRARASGAVPVSLAEALAQAPPRRPAAPDPARRVARSIEVDDRAGLVRRPPGRPLRHGRYRARAWPPTRSPHRLAGYPRLVVDCGGDIALRGAWEVEVEHPLTGECVHTLRLNGGGVATSGLNVRLWRRRRRQLRAPSARPVDRRAGVDGPGRRHRGRRRPRSRQRSLSKLALLSGPAGRARRARRARRDRRPRRRRRRADRPGPPCAEAARLGLGAGGMTGPDPGELRLVARRPRVRRGRAAARDGVRRARAHDGVASSSAGAASRRSSPVSTSRPPWPGSSRSRVHGATLLADPWLRPGVSGVLVPFAMGYRPLFTGLGIVAGYLAALLGLSFYARRRIGARLWRKLHRATVLVWALGVRARARCGHRRRARRGCAGSCWRPAPRSWCCSRSGCCAGRGATARSPAARAQEARA